MNPKIILLINLTNLATTSCDAYAPPVGLYNLAQINPKAIKVIDSLTNPLQETIAAVKEEKPSHIFCMLARDPEVEKVADYCQSLKAQFPKIKITLNKPIENHKTFADFIESKTGAQAIKEILSDRKKAECQANNLPLPLTSTPLEDKGYYIAPDKTLCNKTLELHLPWQGLQEREAPIMPHPGGKWFENLSPWLKDSGFDGLHLRPANLELEQIEPLIAALGECGVKIAMSLPESYPLPPAFLKNQQVRQLWFYNPECSDGLAERFNQLEGSRCNPCLSISREFIATPCMELISKAERLVIEDEELWTLQELKGVVKSFWMKDYKILKRLGKLKSAAELIAYLKSVSKTLEVVLNRKDSR